MPRSSENSGTSPLLTSPLRFQLWPLLAVAALFRFWQLGLKPPHFDEGINGHFVLQIWKDGFYSYDPTNFHGPLYFYFLQLAEVLWGRSVESFRFATAILSTGVVAMAFSLRRFLGPAAMAAAWILAVSPAFTFYGRYAIHETLFVFAQMLFIYGRLNWLQAPSRQAIAQMAAAVVILLSTKETFFIFLGTWFIAEFGVFVLERWERSLRPWSRWSTLGKEEKTLLLQIGIGATVVSLVTLAALFSGFFAKFSGVVDFFRAFDFWTKTGSQGNGHEKPFFYWLELLARYEWGLLLGLAASLYALWKLRTGERWQRVLLLAGFGQWLAYSLIAYKTPWLLLSFWPLAFFLLPPSPESRWVRRTLAASVAFVVAGTSWISWNLNFVNYADPSERYVYVQTTTDYSAVMAVLKQKVDRSPEARNLPIVIMIQDPWPLPYDISLFPKARYAKLEDVSADPSIVATAGLLLIDGSILEGLQKVMPKQFAQMPFQLRDAYSKGWALFDFEAFKDVLAVDVPLVGPGGANAP